VRPVTLRDHLLFWIDSQISVESTFFWTDLRWLMGLPLVPFAVVTMIWLENETIRQVSVILGCALVIPWTFFLFKRRKLKMQTWQEPTRFADKSNGY
jgi:hypothetical protein